MEYTTGTLAIRLKEAHITALNAIAAKAEADGFKFEAKSDIIDYLITIAQAPPEQIAAPMPEGMTLIKETELESLNQRIKTLEAFDRETAETDKQGVITELADVKDEVVRLNTDVERLQTELDEETERLRTTEDELMDIRQKTDNAVILRRDTKSLALMFDIMDQRRETDPEKFIARIFFFLMRPDVNSHLSPQENMNHRNYQSHLDWYAKNYPKK